jgi:hypothetical protein
MRSGKGTIAAGGTFVDHAPVAKRGHAPRPPCVIVEAPAPGPSPASMPCTAPIPPRSSPHRGGWTLAASRWLDPRRIALAGWMAGADPSDFI